MVVTRRRSAAIAMDRSRSSGIVSIDKSPAPPLGKTVKCSATGKSTKKTRSVESTSIVREKVITERTTHEQQSLNKTLPAKSLVDEVEPWEV
ncbi:hypothetical protein LSH36_208g01043 [Paralvinella palmiformis]|uniref:Uncharacterized protein n=1 Tax=Paralvinella palmiformis TaxID=53620 RepID=A0AAD9JP40_9ANNE|nr:hypothetical protein LSH36_208g01043 [Paralvinella palmiformis]